MALLERPEVIKLESGGSCWEHEYDSFYLKAYIPANSLDGQTNNYGYKAPLLMIFEENRSSMDEAVKFADETGLASIAADYDSGVFFIYPTCEGGWENAGENVYAEFIAEVKLHFIYEDGLAPFTEFFTNIFKGYFIRGTKFRTDIYSYGKSADYVATKLLKKLEGEYLWGPGDITPACCSMERLSVTPNVERKDIAIVSVGNSDEINKAFEGCENLLVKDKADYRDDFKKFVRKYKMWVGNIGIEPDFEELKMTEEAGSTVVNTSPDNQGIYKDEPTHKVGYFAYYNNDLFDKGPVPLVIGFHGGGDSALYFAYVTDWWQIAHEENFLFVSIDNHQEVKATEVREIIDDLKKKYNIDEHRIYATGFSMGCGKTWDMYAENSDIFAGLAPASALFPMKDNPFGLSLGDARHNTTTPVPMFYSGGENSFHPELPIDSDGALDRIKYLARTNDLAADFNIEYSDKENWVDHFYGVAPDKVEQIPDESRGSVLTVRYYNSKDGVCRTALASVSNQVHECRPHTCREAWKFISRFTK